MPNHSLLRVSSLALSAAIWAGCGKKDASQSQSAPVKKEGVSVEALAGQPADATTPATPAAPPPPPPIETAKAPASEAAAAQGPVNPKREAQLEIWLERYKNGDAGERAKVVKEVRAANLTPGERASMENTRSRYGYPAIPR
jgi:hypothetical protein